MSSLMKLACLLMKKILQKTNLGFILQYHAKSIFPQTMRKLPATPVAAAADLAATVLPAAKTRAEP